MPKENLKKKSDKYTQRVTFVMSRSQRDLVEKLVRRINDNGKTKNERITANTVYRCMVNLIKNCDADFSSVRSEMGLRKAISEWLRSQKDESTQRGEDAPKDNPSQA